MLCSETGARLRVAPVDDTGQVILEEYEKLLGPKTRLVSVAQVLQRFGNSDAGERDDRSGRTVTERGCLSMGRRLYRTCAQMFNPWTATFTCSPGTRCSLPPGSALSTANPKSLRSPRPWQGGGNMIQDVTFERTSYSQPPARFEAGTGNIADAEGLGAAVDYLDRVGMANITRYEAELLRYGTEALMTVPGLRIIGTAREKAGVLVFHIGRGFARRRSANTSTGMASPCGPGITVPNPIHRRFGIESTARASLAMYNTCADLDALVASLKRLQVGRPHPTS